ncbi:hypothetical protein SAMN04488003_1253 [Loktanella fryxellensis]|uniref:DUF6456 domain-containing protein n=1 Tax=Loktanella fryxellensis TaxID=245187 RepID=A0A1H8IDR9_9RHOB|nr:DUF6456 domain-containing protein [Loktanella fryxellensis]SEN65868.1 hypothetical protein SAMN04488003_1253 [Loktanella fryxellensis]
MTMTGHVMSETVAWVPEQVRHYLAHTVAGTSIRAIARQRCVHPSTILRQVRACEARRDDPLIDAALRILSDTVSRDPSSESPAMPHFQPSHAHGCPDDGRGTRPDAVTPARLNREALHCLRRLCEPGALMAVARDMDSAVIVREDGSGGTLRTAVVEADIAQAMALQDWVACNDPDARILRYHITGAGRTELRRLTARCENRAGGFGTDEANGEWVQPKGGPHLRVVAVETPLIGLSRRRDRLGAPFLDRDLVRVGERLREDFVLSQPGPDVGDDWRAALAAGPAKALHPGVAAARARVVAALTDLGPGLQDAALRCCCLLEGLEITERRMGWSARSGKIVLRIAMQRLLRHYEEVSGRFGPKIR